MLNRYSATALLLFGAFLVFGLPSESWAQTGPGGVEASTGTSTNLKIWMQADQGVSPTTDGSVVTDWVNQSSGFADPDNILGNPTFENGSSDLVGGKPVIRFDGTDDGGGIDQFEFNNSNLDGVPNGENTIIVVSANSGTGNLNQAILGFGDISASGAPGQGGGGSGVRGLLYNLDNQTAGIDITVGAVSGNAKGSGNDKIDSGDKAVSTSYNITPFSIYSSTVETGTGTQDLLANGEVLDDGAASTLSGTPRIGERVDGDVTEVIAFDRRLNAAELQIVYNYLSVRYGISLTGAVTDVYQYDSNHPGDVVGVGNSGSNTIGKSPAGTNTVAQSSGLRLDASGEIFSQDYVLYGHDNANFSFTSVEPPNDRSNIQKLAREWRVDLTDISGSLTGFTMGFDESTLSSSEQLASSTFNDYFLYVDSDGDFSDGNATAYDLTDQGGGLYTNSNVEISDGDYVTIARIKRTFNFTRSLESEFENNAGTVSVEARINFKTNTEITVAPNVAEGSPAPTLGSDYDNVGSGGDWSFAPGSKSSTRTVFDVLDDNDSESNTEFLEVTPSSLPGDLAVGDTTLYEYGIIDEDNNRQIAFDSGPDSDQEGNSGTKTQTFTVAMQNGNTGPASAKFAISGTATAGEDYEIVGASSSDTTRGTVDIPSGETTGTFEIDIIGDELDEADETLDIELYAAQEATLEPGGDLARTFTILDDDPLPEVNFTASSYSGEEGTTVDVVAELESSSGQDLDVTIQDDGGDATAGDDYEDFSPVTVTIPAGDTQGAVSISLFNDGTVETTESFDVSFDAENTDPPLGGTTAATVSIIDASGIGNEGPGGVGEASTLSVWLKSDEGVTTGSGGISSWADQSGNGNDATQTDEGEQPAYGNTTINGIDVATFDGTDDFLRTNVESLPSSSNTLFSVSNAGGAGAVFGVDNGSFESLRTLEYDDASTGAASQDRVTNGNTAVGNGNVGGTAVLSSAFDGSNVSIRENGGGANSVSAGTNSNGTYAILGGEPANAGDQQDPELTAEENTFGGEVAELIAYNTTLNTAQRLIVENYLASKYGLESALSTDLYAGDEQGGSADRDTDVIGIGQASDGDKHFRASGRGLQLTVAGGADNGEFVFAGRKIGVEQRINVTDTSTTNDIGVQARLNDDRYFDVTGTLSADITFDFAEFGVKGPPGDVSNYVLLRRGGTSGDWTKVSVGGVSASGDKVTFSDVTVDDSQDGYFTIGTTSSVDSPLDTRFIAINGESGTASSGENGADAGYFTLGLPITGGTVSSLVIPDGSQFITSNVIGLSGLNSNTAILYKWDYGSQSFTEVTGTGESLPNGRGFYFWVKDDTNIPVDPVLTFGLNDVSNEPTSNQTETVPDQSGTFVFLANPYLSAYDMTAFTNLSDNGFQASIAAWDKDNGGTYGSYVVKTQGTSGDDISRYQGFFLERSSTGSGTTSFTFDNTGRLSENVPLVGAKSTSSKGVRSRLTYRRLGLELTAIDESGNEIAGDKAANLLFLDEGSKAWDAYDAPKYRPPSDTYATLAPMGEGRDGSLISKSQESRPLNPDETLEIPLAMKTKNVSGTFEISTRQFESIPDSWTITLIDTKGTSDPSDDSYHTLRSETGPYTFQQEATSQEKRVVPGGTENPLRKSLTMKASSTSPRFRLKVEPAATTLPVELSDFRATVDNRDVELAWETASERNNAGFIVERKTENGFGELTQVDGSGTASGTNTYRHRLEDLEYGTHTFRLSQVDVGGVTTALDTVAAEVTLKEEYELSEPYPNPFREQAAIDLVVKEAQNVTVSVYNVLGQRVRTLFKGRVQENQPETFRLEGRQLGNGVYFIQVRGETFTANRKTTLVR